MYVDLDWHNKDKYRQHYNDVLQSFEHDDNSFMYIIKISGPILDPCGILQCILCELDSVPFTQV